MSTKRASLSEAGRRNLLELLTEGEDSGMDSRSAKAAGHPNSSGDLSHDDWLDLVEQLLGLSAADFESAVLAVRLHRRLEEATTSRAERGQ